MRLSSENIISRYYPPHTTCISHGVESSGFSGGCFVEIVGLIRTLVTDSHALQTGRPYANRTRTFAITAVPNEKLTPNSIKQEAHHQSRAKNNFEWNTRQKIGPWRGLQFGECLWMLNFKTKHLWRADVRTLWLNGVWYTILSLFSKLIEDCRCGFWICYKWSVWLIIKSLRDHFKNRIWTIVGVRTTRMPIISNAIQYIGIAFEILKNNASVCVSQRRLGFTGLS